MAALREAPPRALPIHEMRPDMMSKNCLFVGNQEDRAHVLLADSRAFDAVESWTTSDLTVTIRVLPC
jgi:hypothetical protein